MKAKRILPPGLGTGNVIAQLGSHLPRAWGREDRWKEREEKTSRVGEPQAAVVPTDEFNRVIIPVKRGEENTDYVNASFIDVSVVCIPESPNVSWRFIWVLQSPDPTNWENYL